MAVDQDDLERRSTSELFALYRGILRQLRVRGVVRTENAPAADYAEFLVARAPAGTLAPNSEKSYDILAGNLRLQVKARVLSEPLKSGQLQLSPLDPSTSMKQSLSCSMTSTTEYDKQQEFLSISYVTSPCTVDTSTGTSPTLAQL